MPSASAYALSLGATLADHQPQDDVLVHLDPVGNPFCLFVAAQVRSRLRSGGAAGGASSPGAAHDFEDPG
ncbi:VOC family protein [Streptacidiphilus sp. N1-10]|uniref:VOC family protein n=1 Tax=Streptacidiphilus jeojiensis TaxID=3229225 RepID=A0ABV6XGK5_9ACTN